MADVRARLAGGDRRSIGEADRVVEEVLDGRVSLPEVIEAMRDDDDVVRMRAADVAEKASAEAPALLRGCEDALLGDLSASGQQEVRWHVALMLPRLRLSPTDRDRALDILLDYLDDHSRIVRVNALQGLAELAEAHEPLRERVTALLREHERDGPASVRARARKLSARLGDEPGLGPRPVARHVRRRGPARGIG